MHPISILALIGPVGSTAFDEMLRLIGIAAIIVAFFKGVGSLIPKPSQSASATPTPATKKTVSPAPAAEVEGISPEIVAIIAAAVSAFTGQAHRVISIKRQSTSWEKAGRQSVLSSHRIR
jgi:hypothetical protein